MNSLSITAALCLVVGVVAAKSDATIPQDVCQASMRVLATSDAMCLKGDPAWASGGRTSQTYNCVDHQGNWFIVTRTPQDKI